MMAQSVFCLVPRGQAAWSPRLDEAVYAGCIPVIIADGYDPPFSAVLNYSLFSVRVNETELVGGRESIADKSSKFGLGLKSILSAITEVRLAYTSACVQPGGCTCVVRTCRLATQRTLCVASTHSRHSL